MNIDLEETTNIAFAAKQTAELLKDIEKEMRSLNEQYGRLTTVRWVMNCTEAPANSPPPESIKTEYCTGIPDVKQIPAIPTRKKDPAKFAQLMSFLKIPEALWNVPEEDEIVRPHFPGLLEMLSNRAAQGLSLPAGIDPHKTHPQYRLMTRSKKAPDE